MDNHQEETTSFEVTVTRDSVSDKEISCNPPIVVDANTLSWSINECSSSFQSVSSCETLESYEQNTLNTESPQVIVVPFMANNMTNNEIGGTLLTNNGVHCPAIKECSIRIDQLKMSSTQSNFVENCEETIIEKFIELPFNSNFTTDCSDKTSSHFLTDDDSSVFEGFGEESTFGIYYEPYKRARGLMKKTDEKARLEARVEPRVEPRVVPRERKNKIETVKRPRQIQRKISKPQISVEKIIRIEPVNQSRTDITEINLPMNPQNITMIPPQISERISPPPAENLDKVDEKKDTSSDSSDSDSDEVTPAAVDNSGNNSHVDRNVDIKNNKKRKEIKKMEKMRRRKELSLVADKIRDHWRETFAAAKRKQHRKAKRAKLEKNKYKTYYTKNDIIQYQYRGQRKRKRVSYSSETDSSDSSNTSKTSYSSSSSDSSNDSDTTHASDTSYTSQTSHRTDSDSSDDSSDVRSRGRHRLNRRRISQPASTDTSDTSSEDDTFDKRRKLHFLRKAIYGKPSSKSKSDDDCVRSRKQKSVMHRPEVKKRRSKSSNRSHDDLRRTKNRHNYSQKQPSHKKLDFPSRSSSAKLRKIKSEFAKRSQIESTSAGDFSVKQCCFD